MSKMFFQRKIQNERHSAYNSCKRYVGKVNLYMWPYRSENYTHDTIATFVANGMGVPNNVINIAVVDNMPIMAHIILATE